MEKKKIIPCVWWGNKDAKRTFSHRGNYAEDTNWQASDESLLKCLDWHTWKVLVEIHSLTWSFSDIWFCFYLQKLSPHL